MSSLAFIAFVLPIASTFPDAAGTDIPSSSAPIDSRTDAGDALHADRARVFLDWGSEARVLRLRASQKSQTSAEKDAVGRLVLASGEPVLASAAQSPVAATTPPSALPMKHVPRAPRVKKTALQSLSALAEILAGGRVRRAAASSANGTPLPHFEARDDDTSRVGYPPR
jgi:hypothetical protein